MEPIEVTDRTIIGQNFDLRLTCYRSKGHMESDTLYIIHSLR